MLFMKDDALISRGLGVTEIFFVVRGEAIAVCDHRLGLKRSPLLLLPPQSKAKTFAAAAVPIRNGDL